MSATALVDASVHEVTWPMRATGAALRLGAGARRGALLVLRWRTASGHETSLGEASPLPGPGATPQLRALRDLAPTLPEAAAARPDLLDTAAGCAELARTLAAPYPAARVAIEVALMAALARRRDLPLAALLAPRRVARLAVNAVVATVDEAARAWARGVRTFKLKLGLDSDGDAALALALRAAFPQARLRGDANRTWPVAEVAARLAALAPARIDYVEEPCLELARALARGERWAVPLALDETALELTRQDLEELMAAPAVAALVLKPTAVGGLGASLEQAALANAAGKPAIVTHALEGPVGFAACAELARALAARWPRDDEPAVGLDHHPGLVAWPLPPPQLTDDAVVEVSAGGLGLEGRAHELLAFAAARGDERAPP